MDKIRMRSSSFPLSPPPSPHPPHHPLASSSSSSLTGCRELDLSVTLSPGHKTCHLQIKPHPQRQARRQRATEVCFEEPVVVEVKPETRIALSKDAPTQQPIKGQRRSRGPHHAPRQSVDPPAEASNPDLCLLDMAELNTTLALKEELQSLQGMGFNFQKAIQETLWKSERTKNLINTRATEVVNISRSQILFTSLVSVNVEKAQLMDQVLLDKSVLATHPHCDYKKAAGGPSSLLFISSNLLRQKPLPPEEEPSTNKLCPSPRPAHLTFDLYRRQRKWEAMP